MPGTTPGTLQTTGGPEGLLATKLHLPRPPTGFVARRRLVDRLDEGLARELTLVCAPAGFGKTSLLADWSQRRERPVGWLSLDAGDNDPVRFWRHVVAALDRGAAGDRRARRPAARSAGTGVVRRAGHGAGQRAGRRTRRACCWCWTTTTSSSPAGARVAVVPDRALPPALHVVLASRADPPFPLARLRARGQLAELRAADLRFTAEEAAAPAARGGRARPAAMTRSRR